MPFPLLVSTDLYGQKVNLPIVFSGDCPPPLPELVNCVTALCDVAQRARLPPGVVDLPFVLEQLQRHHRGEWEELRDTQVLFEREQIYAFQPRSDMHSETAGLIPPPATGACWTPAIGDPPGRCAVPPLTPEERCVALFEELRQGCPPSCGGGEALTIASLREAGVRA
eukprot:Hpha_TRINITY_DN2930_c0_g1::TRINITY_DN2930_c0_g1_i1::g.19543::m.19543